MSVEMNVLKINAIQKVVTMAKRGSLEVTAALKRIKRITEISEEDLFDVQDDPIPKALVEDPFVAGSRLGKCTGGAVPLTI